MEPIVYTASGAELQADNEALRIPETNQVMTHAEPIEDMTVAILAVQDTSNTGHDPDIDNAGSSGPKLAGAGMTEFHKYMDMPWELRARIMEMNMVEDPIVTNPRIIKISMDWNPEEEECLGNHDPPQQPWRNLYYENDDEDGDEDDDDNDDEDGNEDEEDEDEDVHMHVYPDHDNFAWKLEDDSEIRRSHRPLIPYFSVSKECKQIAENFLNKFLGRRYKSFWSPELRDLPLSPRRDIFYTHRETIWEAVNEWGGDLLRAPHDALKMRRFMVDSTTFHGLVVPSARKKDQYLLDVSRRDPFHHFRGESSVTAVFKNAVSIRIISDADKNRVTTYQKLEHAQGEDFSGLPTEQKKVLQSVWRGKNSEFNGLRHSDGSLPQIFFVTVPEENGQKEAQEDDQGDDQ